MGKDASKSTGRPWSLSPDQEVKLKEMWIGLLEPLGILPDGIKRSRTITQDKKSRVSLFGGKKDDDSTEFRKSSHTGTLTPLEAYEAYWSVIKHHHPDAIMLRFLRAREWNVSAALKMLPTALHWSTREMKVHELTRLGEAHALKQSLSSDPAERKEGSDFLALLRKGEAFLHGVDKKGRPVLVVRARVHRPGEQSLEAVKKFSVYMVETIGMMLHAPVDTGTLIFDLADVGLSNLDLAPINFIASVFDKNYPESLGETVVYRAPWIFSSFWKIVKGWLDPDVANKIRMFSSAAELEALIPPEHILREHGGSATYEWEYIEPEDEQPELDMHDKRDEILANRKVIEEAFQNETIKWLGLSTKAEGSEAEVIKEKRNELAKQLAENYWVLDPYVRARTVYDRMGVILPGGKIDFSPSKKLSDLQV